MIYITGDTHGDFSRFTLMDLKAEDLMIVLGDAGINYFLDSRDEFVKDQLNDYPCEFFFLRGNHEERPEKIEGYRLIDSAGTVTGKVYVEDRFPKLMFASEGLYDIGGYRCFVTNGAYSVDKYYRLENGLNWFPDEELTDAEMEETLEKAREAGSVDFILSHTCPERYLPTHVFLPFIDQSKISRRMEKYLDKLADILEYKRWYCGHYHTEWTVDRMRFMYYDIIELR